MRFGCYFPPVVSSLGEMDFKDAHIQEEIRIRDRFHGYPGTPEMTWKWNCDQWYTELIFWRRAHISGNMKELLLEDRLLAMLEE